MSNRKFDAHYYADRLYELLPSVYRSRDSKLELQRFLGVFGQELAHLRRNMDQLWDDFYIDSCQDWVIPYIGDLLGTQVLFNDAAHNRIDVKNSVKWRRQKGTAGGLEQVSRGTSGWGALTAQMFERIVWSQNVNHIRPNARQTVDLQNTHQLSCINTGFESVCRSVDLRPAAAFKGLHRLAQMAVFLWSIPSYSRKGATPAQFAADKYYFSPLGLDTTLYAGGNQDFNCQEFTQESSVSSVVQKPTPDLCQGAVNHIAIRPRDFADNSHFYFGHPSGFNVYEDGVTLCKNSHTQVSLSVTPCRDFYELSYSGGLVVADSGLFAAGHYRITTVQLKSHTQFVEGVPTPTRYSPGVDFSSNFDTGPAIGDIDTTTFVYTKGVSYAPGAPHYHQTFLVLKIETLDLLGPATDFPECEIIVQNDRGKGLLVYLPHYAGLTPGQPLYFYVATDGSTYFARRSRDQGTIDRNPDDGPYGSFLQRHLARAALGQARPVPGIRPVRFRRPVYRRLQCWDPPRFLPLLSGDVAFDPELGRFCFPPGEEPLGVLSVDYRFAITGQVGAGPFERTDSTLSSETSVHQVTVAKYSNADFNNLQDAIDALPEGINDNVVVCIIDSATYNESLSITGKNFPGGLSIQSAGQQMPVISAVAANVVEVSHDSLLGQFTLQGLMLSGGNVEVSGNVLQFNIRFCTLSPYSVNVLYHPVVNAASLSINNIISGPIDVNANVRASNITSSAVQNTSAAVEDPSGHAALSGHAILSLNKVTVLGDTLCISAQISNSILLGDLVFTDKNNSCLRYSRLHNILMEDARKFRCTTDYPIFLSTRFAHAGYLHLVPDVSTAIRQGAEEGGEMGVFYAAGIAWREQNIRFRLEEYQPAGIESTLIRVLPSITCLRS